MHSAATAEPLETIEQYLEASNSGGMLRLEIDPEMGYDQKYAMFC